MNKLTLLVLLLLPACVSQEQLADSRTHALAHAEDVCQGRGVAPGTDAYLKCLRQLGADRGYRLVSDGQQLAFVVPDPNSGKGRIGGGTFYPSVPSIRDTPASR